jgi:hypothetical protein
MAEARAVTNRLARHLVSGGRGTNRFMTKEVGLPACRALVAFGEGRHDDVVELLLPIRATFNRFGGSHAQRDALQRTVLESALQAKRWDLARALLNERLTLRDNSVYAWSQQARLARAQGDERGAQASEAEAVRHRDLFALSP